MSGIPQNFFSTHTKILLSEWDTLSDLIRLISNPPMLHQEVETISSPLLSDLELSNALNGPFHLFFQEKIHAYALITRIRLHLAIADDEQLKSKLSAKNDPIPEKFLQKMSSSELKRIQDQLSTLAREHFQAWQDFFSESKEQLLALLTQQISFSETEIQNFYQNEPISEVHRRFIDLKLKTPKPSKRAHHFEDFLKLKLYLMLHGSLSRQHLPHSDSDITAILKKIDSSLQKFRKQESALANTQKIATQDVIKPLVF